MKVKNMNITKIVSHCTFMVLLAIATQSQGAAQTPCRLVPTEARILTPDEINTIVKQLLDSFDNKMMQNTINNLNQIIELRQREGLSLLSVDEQPVTRNYVGIFLTDQQ